MRPSQQREEARSAAAKLERSSKRLVIETTEQVLKGVKLRAAQEGKTQRAYLLGLLAKDEVPGAVEDLAGPGRR